jgi:hypothetical protein
MEEAPMLLEVEAGTLLFCRPCQREVGFTEEPPNRLRGYCGHSQHPFQPFVELSSQHIRRAFGKRRRNVEELAPQWRKLPTPERVRRTDAVAARLQWEWQQYLEYGEGWEERTANVRLAGVDRPLTTRELSELMEEGR